MKSFAQKNSIPLIHFERGQRKDDVAAEYRKEFNPSEGVVFIGVGQEKANAFRACRKEQKGYVGFVYSRQSVCVNHYDFYIQDRDWTSLTRFDRQNCPLSCRQSQSHL